MEEDKIEIKDLLKIISEFKLEEPEKKQEYISKLAEIETKIQAYQAKHQDKKSKEARKEKKTIEKEILDYMDCIQAITNGWANKKIKQLYSEPEQAAPKEYSEVNIQKLREIYRDNTKEIQKNREVEKRYACLERITAGLEYSMPDMQQLIKTAISMPTEYGLYISVLLNKIIKEDDVVIIEQNVAFDFIGYKLACGTVIVKGDTGKNAGHCMQGGKLILENTGNQAGFRMSGGEILIQGYTKQSLGASMSNGFIEAMKSAESCVGLRMTGGRIVVHENAGKNTGGRMHGGNIEVMGNADDNAGIEMFGGQIIIHGNTGQSPGRDMRNGHLIIKSNAGEYAGYRMKGGLLEIMLTAGDYLGNQINGGKIICNGKAGKHVGHQRKKGIIELKGGYETIAKTTGANKTEIYTS